MKALEFISREMPYILSGEVEKSQRDTEDGNVMIYKCAQVIRIDIKPRPATKTIVSGSAKGKF